MSYVFTPSVTAALTVARRPTVAGDVVPEKMGVPIAGMAGPTGTDGLGRALRAVLIGVLAAELDRAFLRKGRGKRLDERYGIIAGLAALVGMEI